MEDLKNNKIEISEAVKEFNDFLERNKDSIPEFVNNHIEVYVKKTIWRKFSYPVILGSVIIFITYCMFFGTIYLQNKNNKILEETVNNKKEIIDILEHNNRVLNKYIKDKVNSNFFEKELLLDSLPPMHDENGRVLKYSDMKSPFDSLILLQRNKDWRIAHQQIEIIKLRGKLNAINSIYGITINDKFKLTAQKIDSALVLYPYFKNRMKFNKELDKWEINVDK